MNTIDFIWSTWDAIKCLFLIGIMALFYFDKIKAKFKKGEQTK